MFKKVVVTEISKDYLSGGTTRPMKVLGDDGNLYVLKLFSKKDAAQRPYAVAEFFANSIAKQLELNTPDAVVMEVPEELIRIYEKREPEIFNKLLEKDLSKPSFGSLFYKDCPIYSPAVNDKNLETYEFESIYAYDMLILNGDRRKVKPNILRGNHYLLIDHEKAFEGSQHIMSENGKELILPPFYNNHLFYELLKTRNKKPSSPIDFATFEEAFRTMKERHLLDTINFCAELGYNDNAPSEWLRYIVEMKKKCSNFVALLAKSINP